MAIRPVSRAAWKHKLSGLRLLDPKFRDHAGQYVLQCVIATVTIFLILSLLDTMTQTVLVASLGASTFIAFSMPHVESARPRYLVGGYLVGTFSGCTMSVLGGALATTGIFDSDTCLIASASAATGLAIFLMVVSDTEHPPAAALAVGLALNDWNLLTLVVVLGGIIAISTVKEMTRSAMIDLL